MTAILQSFYCVPCIWTGAGLLGIFLTSRYIMTLWMPTYGPMPPGEGKFGGFPSAAARNAYFTTYELRVRTAGKWAIIEAGAWLVGLVAIFLILRSI